MIAALIQAASLAEELSASRHKQITLTLTRRGVLITGEHRDSDGAVLHTYREEVSWQQIVDAKVSMLELHLRDVDRAVTEHWRGAGCVS